MLYICFSRFILVFGVFLFYYQWYFFYHIYIKNIIYVLINLFINHKCSFFFLQILSLISAMNGKDHSYEHKDIYHKNFLLSQGYWSMFGYDGGVEY